MTKTFAILIFIFVPGVSELHAQWHITSSEATGNYSGVFLGMVNRSGLRSSRNTADRTGSKSSELVLLSTVFVPLRGDLTESPTLALGLEIPYASKKFAQNGQPEISHSGIGDVTLVGKYGFTIYKKFTSKQRLLKVRIDLIGKVKFPSGESQRKDAQGLALPHHVQLGSGSTDYALGFAFLTDAGKYFMIHGHAMYGLNTLANGYKAGNGLNYEFAFLLATLPIGSASIGTLLPYFGVKGMHSAKDEMDGMKIDNSGGNVAALSIGLQSLWWYVNSIGTFLMFDTSYQLPVVQRLNGAQMEYGSAFSVGGRVYVK